MKLKVWWLSLLMATIPVAMTATSCTSTSGGQQGVESIEDLSEEEYQRWKLYIDLGVKVGARRLLTEGAVTKKELKTAATAIRAVANGPVQAGTESILRSALEDAGFTNEEAMLIILIAENELKSRGALEGVLNGEGLVTLSPRTKEILNVIADSLEAARVTPTEQQIFEELHQSYNQ
jgi:hypothetical protein